MSDAEQLPLKLIESLRASHQLVDDHYLAPARNDLERNFDRTGDILPGHALDPVSGRTVLAHGSVEP
jgi:hypothetical protein